VKYGGALGLAVALALAAACGKSSGEGAGAAVDAGGDAGDDVASEPAPIAIDSSPQRGGDAMKGYDALVNNGYVGCGIPYSAYSQVFPAAPANQRIAGRNAMNTTMAYNVTRFTTAEGVDVAGPNCLACHASPLLGNVVIGLGDTYQDFTVDYAGQASAAQLLVTDPMEQAELTKFIARATALSPYIRTTTLGVTPADNIAAVLFAHRDRNTLAWSDTPLLTLPPKIALPVDVPPWWRMSKKNAMFYTAAGRGDHARIMMTASTLCVDSVAIADSIDAYFPDIRAYVETLGPPAYPFPTDATLVAKGKGIFESTCSRCHGTYGAGGVYPNYVIAIADVATDPILATGAAEFATDYVTWFNESYYGKIAHLDSQKGYYAPPLDGVWATAPFFHNGSVPNIELVLDSTKRPQFWTRAFDSNDFDKTNVGWNFTPLAAGQDAEPSAAKKKKIYDTTQLGYGNGGHTYGDALSTDDRTAVIEYLKTL
jgi:cytochrome c5